MMPHLAAAMISLGVLGAIDTYLTATVLPVPVWVTFIAWASFFSCGGGIDGLVKSIIRNWTGIAIASLTLLVIATTPGHPIVAAVCVGIGTAAMVATSAFPPLAFPPAIVFGFASTVGTSAATGQTILSGDISHPTVVTAVAMLVGGAFGYLSEICTDLLTANDEAAAT